MSSFPQQGRQGNFLGATVIDLDLDANNLFSGDLPGWLGDVLARSLSASGFRSQKKIASKEAIQSLRPVNLASVVEDRCPICFEQYESDSLDVEAANAQEREGTSSFSSANSKLLKQDNNVCLNLRKLNENIYMESKLESLNFNDPAMFFPVSEAGNMSLRFPLNNLYSRDEVTIEDMIPGFKDTEDLLGNLKESAISDSRHIPVKMPDCEHVFGKSCIIEWLHSNVSCPLCRKEVESKTELSPREQRKQKLQSSIRNNFNIDQEASMNHLLDNSTDVFNPFKRPFNPSVTPLTDSYIQQSWCNSRFSPITRESLSVPSRDPDIISPRPFPFSEGMSSVFSRSLRTRPPRNAVRRSTDQEQNSSTVLATENRGTTPESTGSQTVPESGLHENETTGSINQSSSSINSIRIGPDRSTRLRNQNNRTHPYSRPPDSS